MAENGGAETGAASSVPLARTPVGGSTGSAAPAAMPNLVPPHSHGDAAPARKRSSRAPMPPPKRQRQRRIDTYSEAELKAARERLKKERGKPRLDAQASQTILFVRLSRALQRAEYERKTKKKPATKLRDDVVFLTGYSASTIAKVVKEASKETVYVSSAGGNAHAKKHRVPHTKAVAKCVRDYIRGMRSRKERVTSTQVLGELRRLGHVFVEVNEQGQVIKKSVASALRAVQRYLRILGLRRGRRKDGQISYKAHIAEQRVHYMNVMLANRSLPPEERLREVYIDESYIHRHLHYLKDSLYDPMDTQDLQIKWEHKGDRFCFTAAIQGPDPRLHHPESAPQGRRAGYIIGSLWKFKPATKKQMEAAKKDYHRVFNGENFTAWFEKLMELLDQPSLIIMDNASYHLVFPAGTPKPRKMVRAELEAELQKPPYNMPLEVVKKLKAVDLKRQLAFMQKALLKVRVRQVAEAHGHEVLFTPAHHSDLQPIELVWARVKGNIGREYNESTTMAHIEARLEEEFQKLGEDEGAAAVGKMIKHTDKVFDSFVAEVKAEMEEAEAAAAKRPKTAQAVDIFPDAALADSSAIDCGAVQGVAAARRRKEEADASSSTSWAEHMQGISEESDDTSSDAASNSDDSDGEGCDDEAAYGFYMD